MQTQPGDQILTGRVDGQKIGQAFFQLLPSMPFEGPPFLPRFMAQRLFPAGFLRQQPAALQVPPVVRPAIPANQVVAAPQPVANQAVRTQVIPQPAPAGYRSAGQGGEPVSARSQKIRLHERAGM